LISLPSHEHPAEYARQLLAGTAKHVPCAPHAALGAKPHISLALQSTVVMHGIGVVTTSDVPVSVPPSVTLLFTPLIEELQPDPNRANPETKMRPLKLRMIEVSLLLAGYASKSLEPMRAIRSIDKCASIAE
jgi:hypothetical protein